ncbi:MAG: hypothetical protein L0Y75_00330, partial [Acidobacteria bacterium]|nr:hypothetical protein [Acidobacteriota bacterium]
GGDGETRRQGDKERLSLSPIAQRKLIDYVNAGGILVCTPSAPRISELSGNDRVVVMPDYWSAIPIEPGKAKRDEVIAAVQNAAVEFVSRLARLGVNRRVKARVTKGGKQPLPSSAGATIEPDFVATQLVADHPVGSPSHGFINVANFDSAKEMRVVLNIADPAPLAEGASTARVEMPELTLRPRDALLLPIRVPLRSSEKDPAATFAGHVPSFAGEEREEIYYATAELISREVANGRIAMRFYAPDPAEVVLRLPHAPQGAVTINGAPAISSYDAQSKLLKIRIADARKSAKAKDEDELAGRREHERDVLIVYETGLPDLNVKTSRLIIGDDNLITVDVVNRTTDAIRGSLRLIATRSLKSERFEQPIELKPQESRQFNFKMSLNAKSVEDDQVVLRAMLAESRIHFSPSVTAEIRPRFEWRVFPKSTWPARADTRASVHPPLIYPSDDNATSANFNMRMGNNSAEAITINRKSMLVSSLPLNLKPDEEYMSAYSYNFVPETKAVLNPFTVTIGDGKLTETARVNCVALRKGEAVAFAYDMDGDGFDDYVMENDFLRLIISPNAGARSFALINKRTGVNVFTSVGGLRDKFVELKPQNPTRNPRRKVGMYGTFNRPYIAEIKEGMGKRVALSLSYNAPDVYTAWPSGGRIERVITLNAGEEYFTVDYRVTPKDVDGKQAFWSSNSIIAGDPVIKARRFVSAGGLFDFAPMKTHMMDGSIGWVAAQISNTETFAVMWRPDEVSKAEVEMKDFSSFVNVKFKPFTVAGEHNYRLAFYFGVLKAEQIAASRSRILGG